MAARIRHCLGMNSQRWPFLLLAGLLLLSGCGKGASSPAASPAVAQDIDPVHGHLLHAQPTLPTIKLWLGDQELKTEIASRPIEIATGMMFRTNMPENEAMLFVFAGPGPRSFYMRNCIVPLSAAYISPGSEILEIINMKPHDETGIPSQSDNVQFVLEVPQGWFTRHGIGPGAIIRTERGSLLQTFFPNR